ncbi:MAG: LysM peptidoglycan-binding domain-containing protein [Clostridiales bacterium]|nr:LysM peptidoglycan-binding domain-containing protein [Clostridiales bacterium]
MKGRNLGKIIIPVCLSVLLTGFTIPDFNISAINNSNTENINIIENKQEKPSVYSMYINDKNIGLVEFPAHSLRVYDQVIEKIKNKYEEGIIIEADVYFKESNGDHIIKDQELVSAIEEAIQIKKMAHGIVIDGDIACYLNSEEEIQQLLEMIKNPYLKDVEQRENASLEKIEIKEEISIKQDMVLYQDILDIDSAFQVITQGPDALKTYVVKEGDSLWSIANENDSSVDELYEANPDLEGDIIQPGQELKLFAPRNLITVITEEKVKETEEIDFEKEVRQTDKLYKGESRVVQEGSKGEKEIEYLIIRENGTRKEKKVIDETVIKEPVNEIIEEGTKSKPTPKPKATSKRSTSSSRSSSSSSSSSSNRSYTPIVRNGVEMTPWYEGANKVFSRGSVAKVTHVDTGLTFYAKRRGGTNHADCEPLTKKDTEIMKKIYGGSWSWSRKAIIVEVNGKKMAASMNGMPHGRSSISGNGFSGHFCIHFYGSKGHGNPRQDPDHQAMVKRALGK